MTLQKATANKRSIKASTRRFASKGWVQLIAKALGITLLAFLLSNLLTAPFSASTSAIFSSPEKSDFILPDLFAQVADSRPVRKYDDRIAIVDIRDAGRDEIADILEILSLCEPAAVGLDVNFAEHKENDSRLLQAISLHPGIVLPLAVEQMVSRTNGQAVSHVDKDSERFKVSESPFFYGQLSGVSYGIVNFPTRNTQATIREMPVDFRMNSGERIPSFVEALAEKADPEAAKASRASGNKRENISFHSREFKTIPYEDTADRAEELAGKIILVGSCTDASDFHPTPIQDSMPGIMVHAHALSTLLDGDWLRPMPGYLDLLIAAVMCFIIVMSTVCITSKVRGLIVRIMQVVAVYLAVRIGYALYVDHNIICNLSRTLLMIAFGLFAVDIWNGFAVIGDSSIKGIKRIRNKYKNNLTCEKSF